MLKYAARCAENTVVTTTKPTKKSTAKSTTTAKETKSAARKAAAAMPRQRTRQTRTAPIAAAPVVPKPVVRRPRPLVVSVRRSDGSGLSFTERLEAAMHKRLGHDGPVCHGCRMNASQLAAAAKAPSPLAI